MGNVRKTEILKKGKWVETDFKNIRVGDVFRLFEPTGEPVVDEKGNNQFTAKTNAYITDDGVYGVEVV